MFRMNREFLPVIRALSGSKGRMVVKGKLIKQNGE